jgi:hypothetical protein
MAPLTEVDVDFIPTPPQAKSTIESLGDKVGVKITTVSCLCAPTTPQSTPYNHLSAHIHALATADGRTETELQTADTFAVLNL